MAVLVVVLVVVVGVPGALAVLLALRGRRPGANRTLVSGMQHRLDVATQLHSMGMSGTGYVPEDRQASEHA